MRGTASRNWDFSLVQDTVVGLLGEAGSVQFRAEIFNILNHPDFSFPNTVAFGGDPTFLSPFSQAPESNFGQITATNGKPRQIQFALKILF
jgi:hypothetical protein